MTIRKALFRVSILAAVAGVLAATANAQDFQKSYRIGQGGSVRVHNVSGDVNIRGYDGDQITVAGFREGRDANLVSVEDLSEGNGVNVRARYPEHCNGNASIRFELQVPRAIMYSFDQVGTASGNVLVDSVTGNVEAKTASGNIEISNVTGRVNAHTASGNVDVKNVSGAASARAASGNVSVSIARLEGSDSMNFSTASGDVIVKMPSDLDAEVDMHSMSGSLRTDFPITISEPRFGPGRSARGRLGAGSRTLKISSASGNASLLRF
jgi:DUF4097 and DUF4098 domain-containing protein YvlB